jgi:hypothetical protein
VTVTFTVPVVAVALAVNVSVEVPLPGAAMEAGLKEAVTPAGNPETDNETAELNPPTTAVVMAEVTVEAWATETLAGEALMVKSGVAGAFTVRAIVVV